MTTISRAYLTPCCFSIAVNIESNNPDNETIKNFNGPLPESSLFPYEHFFIMPFMFAYPNAIDFDHIDVAGSFFFLDLDSIGNYF